jgi:hypothetical protein
MVYRTVKNTTGTGNYWLTNRQKYRFVIKKCVGETV